MPETNRHSVAIDLGADSGRIMLGTLDEGRLSLEEIYRFPTAAVPVGDSLHSDIDRVFGEIVAGLRRIAARGIEPASVSANSWGVDYAYVRPGQRPPALPYHYRDPRTAGALETAEARAAREFVFEATGIQSMSINTLYQLLDDRDRRPELMASAERFLGIGDYVNYLLSGRAVAETSLASTTQLYDPRRGAWSEAVIERFRLPARLFPPLVPSGTVLGPLADAWAGELGWRRTQVVATCSHDTGASVAAVPAEGEDWAYLSSGTWSLLGIETSAPVITPASRAANFTNEAGLGGTTRLLKNLVGLWIVQECRRAWHKEGLDYGYAEIDRMAAGASSLRSLIDPADPRFAVPGRMPEKIAAYCAETGQPIPESPGETVRCAYESLALSYRATLRQLEEISGRPIRRLHVVGGGSQSALLNQLAADATQLPVLSGPVEATAIGNLLIQALALGRLSSPAALRRVVRDSFPCVFYQPRDWAPWEEAAERFKALKP